ncbi:MAG: SPOR domain-containing protein [Janthinobacterium lividum]
MNTPKWQSEFQPCPEDRFVAQKRSLIDLPFLKKYSIYSVSTIAVLSVLWYVFAPSHLTSDEELPVIESPLGPYKTKPLNQDANKDLVQNKTIYEKLSAKKPDEKVEHLLQEPEEPVAPPPTLSAEFLGNLMNEDMASEGTIGELEASKQTAPALQNVEDQTQRQDALKTFFHQHDSEEEPSVPSNDKKSVPTEERVEKPMAVTVTGSSVKSKTPPSVSSTPNTLTPTHWIQLASVRSKEAAEREWKRLNSLGKLKPLLASFKPVYGSVDMGEGEGIHHRLRIGLLPFKDAKNLCSKLRDLKVDCIVKKNQ